MIVGSMPCPLYLREKRIVNEDLSVKYDSENSDLYKYLSEHTGQNITSILDVESIYNILEIQVRKYEQTLFVNYCALAIALDLLFLVLSGHFYTVFQTPEKMFYSTLLFKVVILCNRHYSMAFIVI